MRDDGKRELVCTCAAQEKTFKECEVGVKVKAYNVKIPTRYPTWFEEDAQYRLLDRILTIIDPIEEVTYNVMIDWDRHWIE